MRQTVRISLEIEVEFEREEFEDSADLSLHSVTIEGSKIALTDIAGLIVKAAEEQIDQKDWE